MASSDPVGTNFCTDGTINLEVCGVVIYATGQTVTYDGQTITGLVYGVQTNNINAFSAGNSGGPAYTMTSGGVTALGMIEARVTGADYYGWYMPARTVNSYFGVFVKTS